MSADQDVNASALDPLQNRLLLLWRAKARDHLDLDRELLKAFLEGLEMLEAEHRRWCKHRNLSAILHRLEGRTHRDLSLAVTYVAAEQPVHRRGRLHVPLDVGDGRYLIVGLAVIEGVFKLALELIVPWKSVALRGLALRIKFQQLICHVLHGLLDARLCLGPLLRSQAVEHRRRSRIGGAVFLNEIKARERDIQARLLRKLQHHELDGHGILIDLFQTEIARDAMLH